MSFNITSFLKLFTAKNTLLRDLQINECSNIKVNGLSLEFGTIDNKNKTFSNFVIGKSKFEYSNITGNKKLNIFSADLTRKLKIKSNKYNNIFLLNVLEHLPVYKSAFKETNRILKKSGKLIGSVPFLYQVHGAPNDYFRYTKDFLELNLKKNGFKKIKVKPIGFGPFVASYSLIYPYIKYLPFFCQIILLLALLTDRFIQFFVKTNLNEIFPIGYFFIAKK